MMNWRTNKLSDLRKDYAEELYPIYGKHESDAMLSLLIKRYFNLSKSDLIVNPDHRLSESEILRLHFAVKDLKRHRPIQYILKYIDFLNTRIMVNESVLIPRPETEELVTLIINQEKKETGLKILDIGTGSGCIAIALAKNLQSSEVTGIDVSANALKIASKNIIVNEVMVHFTESDILAPHGEGDLGQFDIIVSNPPYVTQSDKERMNENVLKYEPHEALFVPAGDPLLFYNAILYYAGEHLTDSGRIYFEVNEGFGKEVSALLENSNYQSVELMKDIHGKERFVSGVKEWRGLRE